MCRLSFLLAARLGLIDVVKSKSNPESEKKRNIKQLGTPARNCFERRQWQPKIVVIATHATKLQLLPRTSHAKLPLTEFIPIYHAFHGNFLVACYATLHPAMSVDRSVGWSVGRLVGRSSFYFFGVFELFKLTSPAQMPWWALSLLLPTCTRLG